jgi:Calcineurin-like phosphoesterase
MTGDADLRRSGEHKRPIGVVHSRNGAARDDGELAIFGHRMRTLVISDLHLGTRLGRDVLRRPEPLEALLEAVSGADRLVLLGDVVELLEGRASRAMEIAAPVVRAIGARLGPEREAIVVPGNHDAPLVRPWLRAHGGPATVDAAIPPAATPALARLTGWLAPARVRVHYPGVWLGDGVWATHGHYLDLHLLPESGYGMARGLLGRLPRDGAVPAEYERPGVPRVTRGEALLTRWLPRPLAAAADDVAELLRAATMAGLAPRRGLQLRLAPVLARLLGAQMRHASLPALARVVHRLGVGADHVVFGHVHRLGPLAGDDPRRWRGPDGRPLLANTGSWTYEPLLLHRAQAPHPYWPGGALVLEDGAPPRAVGLLDHLGPAAVRAGLQRPARARARRSGTL